MLLPFVLFLLQSLVDFYVLAVRGELDDRLFAGGREAFRATAALLLAADVHRVDALDLGAFKALFHRLLDHRLVRVRMYEEGVFFLLHHRHALFRQHRL